MSHRQISRNERIKLSGFQKAGLSVSESARTLGKDPTTIRRELRKGCARGLHGVYHYSWRKAERVTDARRSLANQRHRRLGVDADLTSYVRSKLSLDQSPEQIVGRMRGFGDRRISAMSIYRYLDVQAPELRSHLHSQKGKYRRTQAAGIRAAYRQRISLKRDIETRPIQARRRTECGHWEGDTIVGTDRKVRILTQVDRRSGYLAAAVLPDSSAASVRVGTNATLGNIARSKCLTLTLDNGHEFTEWDLLEKDTGVTVYFAKPYHSWERGTNENTNGLLRHYFPKKSSFATLTPRALSRAVARLNHRPRRRLGYLTPHEVFHGRAI